MQVPPPLPPPTFIDNSKTRVYHAKLIQGCKMVSIAVHTRPLPPVLGAPEDTRRLKDSGLWYPTIPSQNLDLNEESFLPRHAYLAGYKPLLWCHFGGPGGLYLQYLTGITVTSSFPDRIFSIQFSFDNEIVPPEHRTLGCSIEDEPGKKVVQFSIDGPGGERIEAIEMYQFYVETRGNFLWLIKEGTMVLCEVRL